MYFDGKKVSDRDKAEIGYFDLMTKGFYQNRWNLCMEMATRFLIAIKAAQKCFYKIKAIKLKKSKH